MEKITGEERKLILKEIADILRGPRYQYGDFEYTSLPRGIDIKAKKKNGDDWHYLAISVLSKKEDGSYFGSTNTSEWNVEKNHDGRMFFVIAMINPENKKMEDILFLSPDRMASISQSHTFKVTFTVKFDLKGELKTEDRYSKDDIRKLL